MVQRTAFLILMAALIGAAGAPARANSPVVATSVQSGAMPAPEELSVLGSGWTLRGSGVLRFFGFKAYDAHLWLLSEGAGFSYAQPFALDIRYDMRIKGEDIINTSLIELSRITPTTPEQLKAWTALMNSIFVDVKSGDRLVGVHLPERGVRFFLNGRLIGESADTAFSVAFFNIWLHPQTKRPELRDRLLGQADTRSLAR